LLGLLVGGGEDALVALDDRRDGEPHAGVAGGPFDDRAARLEAAVPLGVLDHLDRHAVLDRVAGVEGLHLGEDGPLDDPLGDAVDAHQGRLADGIEDVVADLLHRVGIIPRIRVRYDAGGPELRRYVWTTRPRARPWMRPVRSPGRRRKSSARTKTPR